MTEDPRIEQSEDAGAEPELLSRREYLVGLKKWSAAVIGAALVGAILAPEEARAGGWVNRRGYGGGGAWANRSGGWVNGRAGWVNAIGGGGSAWVNGGGGGWINGRGGWIN